MSPIVETIELVGDPETSWEDAAQNALDDVDETLEEISGLEITSQTADVQDGEITHYKTTLNVAFVLQR